LARQLAKLRWKLTLKEGELALTAEGVGWRQVAGTVLSDILVAQQHELWPRLKACRNPPCSVVFYDSSKNQSRVWHNTSVCGNLINLRASQARVVAATLDLSGVEVLLRAWQRIAELTERDGREQRRLVGRVMSG